MLNLMRYQFLMLSLLLTNCSSGNKQSLVPVPLEPVLKPPDGVSNEAQVKNVKINIFESFPVRVDVVVRGELADNCTTLDQFLPERNGNLFTVRITTNRQTGKYCEKQPQPFDLVLPLEVEDLKAGSYTVSVNGVKESFVLNVDNVLEPRRN